MANVLKHVFVSAKADGADATLVQASHWNDGHTFVGGSDGNVLVRDSGEAYGVKWSAEPALTTVAVGPDPAVTGAIRLSKGSVITIRNVADDADLYIAAIHASTSVLQLGGQDNDTQVLAEDLIELKVGGATYRMEGGVFRPTENNARDLGGGSARWATLYVQTINAAGVITATGGMGTTPLDASQLTSGTVPDARIGSSGTYTPVDASGAGLAFTSVLGSWVKSGPIVAVAVDVTYPATANGSIANISLPFTVVGTTEFVGNALSGLGASLVVRGLPSLSFVYITDATNINLSKTNAQLTGQIVRFSIVYRWQ